MNEDQRIKDLQNAIQKTQVYLMAPSAKHQNSLLKARSWRPQWEELAERAGIGSRLSDIVYSYMSQFAYSTSMSGWQLTTADTPEPREDMVRLGLFIIEIAMAKLIEGFVSLFPPAQTVFDKHPVRDLARGIAAVARQMP